ncbi:glycosyltransferase family 2 protein [Candidatus Magnetominusculus dajiuhuensis]|uniref:glycosyltransferase family 2 protein n=1 Tax=Candidatus Magnetominusculus dajiuhuensis TaxID=3137712 RepID=UPI003B427E98
MKSELQAPGKKLTLSVLMPNYNCARYIAEAIESILNQSRPPDEFIICDDASTDNSVEIIEAYAQRHPVIKFIRNETNLGPLDTFNRMLDITTGDYLYAAPSDNYILPGFFEKATRLLTTYPETGLFAAFAYAINVKGRRIEIQYSPGMTTKTGFIPPEEMLAIMTQAGCGMLNGNTFIFKRLNMLECGGFSKELHYYNDVLLGFLMIAKHGVCFIPEPFVCVRYRSESLSAKYQLNSELMREEAAKMLHIMQRSYSDIIPAAILDAYGKNVYYDIYFQNIYSLRKSMLVKYSQLNKSPVGRLFYFIINMFLYIKYAFVIIHYLYSNKFNIVTFIRNYISNVLYEIKHKRLLR